MANTLKWPGSLKKKVNGWRFGRIKNYITLLAVIAFIIVAAFTFYRYMHYGILILAGIFAFGIIIMISAFPALSVKERGLLRGNEGEMLVERKLDRILPAGWIVINDIIINGSQIDHLVLGPAGIYCLETKHWNNAGCDAGGRWYRFHLGSWVAVPENPAAQNSRHVMALQEFIRQKCKIKNGITSVIVLSNTHGRFQIESGTIPPDNTLIYGLNGLPNLFKHHHKEKLTRMQTAAIAEAVMSVQHQPAKNSVPPVV
ncbi:nuclease-related domain-containing protein [Desulfotomaculum copahuensis]|uniref:NERD domain-containing protein n=1 Tax=Desulfotomaculum copahuensis TaxID=1838280 RepID=A0A1B7LD92_9FIRM|nr:nuclease-related domain-containing protein [Desulfotomaculum copahuensis]OAT81057.1 hypothetical protein A6M21_12075 [Desulfotomaculum copahuensis]